LSSIDDFSPLPEDNGDSELRLQVFLARAGACSRRGAAEILQVGRVRVNGQVIREPGFRIKPEDIVTLDGKTVKLAKNLVYIALHKPAGYVCSSHDPEGRALALDLLGSYADVRLFSVGRLDFLSKGLIFFTNDGAFSNIVSHPRSGVEKEYIVETKKDVPQEFFEEFKKGIYFEGVRYHIESYKINSPRECTLILTEGKNREIRNAFSARNHTIKSLTRVRIGCVKLGSLQEGRYRSLQDHEIIWLVDHSKGVLHGRRH